MAALLVAFVLSGDPVLTTEPYCHLDSKALTVHIAINPDWNLPDGGTEPHPGTLYSFHCDIPARTCNGAFLNCERTKVKHGSISPMANIDLISAGKGGAIVEWGAYRFTLDVKAGTVTRTPTIAGGPSPFVARCK